METYEIWGNTLKQWLIAIVIVAAGVIVVRLLKMFGRRILRPFVERSKNDIDNIIYDALEAPVRFAVMLLALWIAIHRLVYPDSLVVYIDRSFRILIVLDITWFVARLATSLMERHWQRDAERNATRMLPVMRRALLVVVWVVGTITALSHVGVDISALWGTLGIGGIAFALAAQDTVKNVFGAITIFTDKPFAIGDTVRIGDVEGTVVDVGMRSTLIMGYDRRVTSYPNYRIMEAAIVNISSEPLRRASVRMTLAYDTSAAKMNRALGIMRSVPQRVAGVSRRDGDTTAYFAEYGDTALVVILYYYIEKGADILGVTSEVNLDILKLFSEEGLRFAAPVQSIILDERTVK